jgi:hypothetical protein
MTSVTVDFAIFRTASSMSGRVQGPNASTVAAFQTAERLTRDILSSSSDVRLER